VDWPKVACIKSGDITLKVYINAGTIFAVNKVITLH
jgi:hypothetical protein